MSARVSQAEQILSDFNVQFTTNAAQKFRLIGDNLLQRKVVRDEKQRNRFEEFLFLNAAEAKIVMNAARLEPKIVVDDWDAQVAILKCDTTLTGGCPLLEQRIGAGRLEGPDIFFFRGDWQKLTELDVSLQNILTTPVQVARQFLGKIPEISVLREQVGSAIISPAIPIQALTWKFKLDIINYGKNVAEIRAWMRDNEIIRQVQDWPLQFR
jgi:hypothetical protein